MTKYTNESQAIEKINAEIEGAEAIVSAANYSSDQLATIEKEANEIIADSDRIMEWLDFYEANQGAMAVIDAKKTIRRLLLVLDQGLMIPLGRYILAPAGSKLISPAGFHPSENVYVLIRGSVSVDRLPNAAPGMIYFDLEELAA